jgi:hypothetical protein
VRYAEQNARKNRKRKEQQVEPAVACGAGHFRCTNLMQFYPK